MRTLRLRWTIPSLAKRAEVTGRVCRVSGWWYGRCRPVPFKKAAAARKNDDVIRKGDMAALDYSKSTEDDASDAVVVPDHLVDRDAMAKLRTAGTGEYEIPNFEVPADDDDDDEAGAAAAAAVRPGSPAAKAGTAGAWRVSAGRSALPSLPTSMARADLAGDLARAAGRGAPAPRASGMFAFFQNLTGQKVRTHACGCGQRNRRIVVGLASCVSRVVSLAWALRAL